MTSWIARSWQASLRNLWHSCPQWLVMFGLFGAIAISSIANLILKQSVIEELSQQQRPEEWPLSLHTLHQYADELEQVALSHDLARHTQVVTRVEAILENADREIYRLRHASKVQDEEGVLSLATLQHLFTRSYEESLNLIELPESVSVDRRALQSFALSQAVASIHSYLADSAEARRAVRSRVEAVLIQNSLSRGFWYLPILGGIAGTIVSIYAICSKWRAIQNRPSEAFDLDAEYIRDMAAEGPTAMLALDPTGIIRWANVAAASLLHTSRQAMIDSSFPKFVAEADRVHDFLTRIQRGESLNEYSLTLHTEDGATVHTLLDATACLKRGYFTHVRCVIHDVTGRLLVEQAYRASERRLAAVINHSPTGLFLADEDGANTFVNAKWCELTGMSAELAAGYGWSTAVHPDDRESVLQEWQRCSRSGEDFQLEYRYLKPDGSTTWVVGRAVALRNEEGNLTQLLGSVTDITHVKQAEQLLAEDIAERKVVEEQLRRSEERFELAVSGSNDVVMDWNVLTDEVYFSPRLAELLGYEVTEMQPNKQWLFRLLHPQDRRRTQATLDEHLKSDLPYVIEHRVRTKSGEFRWFNSRGHVIRNDQGRPIRMVGTTSDITDQKLQEEALRKYAAELEISRSLIEGQAQELKQQAAMLLAANRIAQAASEAKGRFLANMSHEIRTPLNAILGMTELVLDGDLPREQQELLRIVNSSGEHLLTVINNILDFSKIECGKLDLVISPFSIRDCLRDVLEMFQVTASEKGICVQSDIDQAVPQFLTGDAGRLRQILVNLVGNAIKFTPKGTVDVILRAVPGTLAARWHFTVADTGIGIPAEKLKTIFHPFEQADSSTTRQFGGSGLGLAIVSELVNLMNGRTWVESTVGAGSRFHFEVELRVALAPVPSRNSPILPRALSQSEAKRWKVLVAEDSDANQRLIKMLLEKKGYDVTLVADGRALVDTAARETFDLLLVDIQMPKLSGLEATIEIRNSELAIGAGRVPIVALTANAAQGDREECLSAGMDGYISKPIRSDELFAELRRVVDESMRLSACRN
jgi:PAS domain S-box-containing protein